MKSFFRKTKPVTPGQLHVRIEYDVDAKFVADMIDTGFDTFQRINALMSGKPDPRKEPDHATQNCSQIAET